MGWVLFFDGDCAFCSRSVKEVAKRDKRGNVSFAPLQGKLAEEKGFSGHAVDKGGTMILLREEDGKVFTRSDAWLELTKALGGGWQFFRIFQWIPRPLRDWVYQMVADNRHLLFGKSDSCSLADPVVAGRLRE